MILQLLIKLSVFLLFASLSASAAEQSQLKAFPDAMPGMQRVVIELAHKDRKQEQNYKVELIVGREMQTDGVNQIRLASQIEPHPLKGWGYTYYEVEPESAIISTMMAAPEGAPMITQFVTTAPLTIRYNSRLPVVVYVPEGYQVHYRIWAAPEQYQVASQGQVRP